MYLWTALARMQVVVLAKDTPVLPSPITKISVRSLLNSKRRAKSWTMNTEITFRPTVRSR